MKQLYWSMRGDATVNDDSTDAVRELHNVIQAVVRKINTSGEDNIESITIDDIDVEEY